MNQKFEPLNTDDLADIEAKRAWVRGHFDESAQHKYVLLEEKLRLLDTILQSGWIASDETFKLQCLGITFGDALAQKLGLTWVAVEDEYGRDPALMLSDTTLKMFPLTTISKRVEKGEKVDVYELFKNACDTINQLKMNLADESEFN
jgi:Domain of unknown function (DUF3806)